MSGTAPSRAGWFFAGPALFVIVPGFSQNNARASIDGHKAVYSHNLP